jgi:dTDP-4-amino-4,6-dideoxygalactose transaminase
LDFQIPFHKPYTDEAEIIAASKALRSGVLRGDGPQSRRMQHIIQEDTGAKYAYLTTSCTHALEIALMVLNIRAGDEIIMPSFTFVSSANAAVLNAATPVFADICEGTLNLDMNDVVRKITKRTRAIIPVHYAGVSVDMDVLKEISLAYGIPIIEDAAQGVDATHKNMHLGTLGDMGCYSFHDTKNITCGEGGALLTNNQDLARKIEIIREKGTNRSAFLRGEVDRYTWVSQGSSYIQSDILAAVLEAQWNKRAIIKKKRQEVWQAYHTILEPLEIAKWLNRPVIPSFAASNYHTYFFTTRRTSDRDPLLEEFKKSGIAASFHYVPLHSSPFGKQIGADLHNLPKTDRLSSSLIRLPLYPALAVDFPDYLTRIEEVLYRYFRRN